MYRIERDNGQFVVRHYVAGDPKPTAGTEKLFDRAPEALTEALGRAAKQSLILRKTITVEMEDGHTFAVIAYPSAHPFEPDATEKLYCAICGGNETDHIV